MSDPVLDGLARTLAQPMPRRRAVRVMAAGFLAAAVPALRPGRSAAGGCGDCPDGQEDCGCGDCCDGQCVGPNFECCAGDRVCGNSCCPPDEVCSGGRVCCPPCKGESNRVASVETASGDNLGLTDKQLCRDQEVKAKEATKVHLGDGSVVTLEAGNGWKVRKCAPDDSIWDLIGDKIINIFAGDAKFNIQTDRAVIGVRGTEFTTTYDAAKKRTTVKVKSGKVQVWAKRNPKKKVTAGKGDTVIQQGNEPPKVKG